ncbi:MAG: CRISPR-associated protein Cas4 [Promethearchaeota archaeon]
MEIDEILNFTGTQINYYFHCHRQLWLFSHHITCEQDSDVVYLGKLIHESTFEREKKEIEIDHLKLDFLDVKDEILHEVKKSDSFEEAHHWQVLYYLYFLKQKGIEDFKGEIHYPKMKKKVVLELTEDKEKELTEILSHIEKIVNLNSPPPISVKLSVCRKCSYYELCWIE